MRWSIHTMIGRNEGAWRFAGGASDTMERARSEYVAALSSRFRHPISRHRYADREKSLTMLVRVASKTTMDDDFGTSQKAPSPG